MILRFYSLIIFSLGFICCNNEPEIKSVDEMKTVKYVDLERYMGDWYVIANIPTFIEKRLRMQSSLTNFQMMEPSVQPFLSLKDRLVAKKKSTVLKVLFIINKPMRNGGCNFCGLLKCHF